MTALLTPTATSASPARDADAADPTVDMTVMAEVAAQYGSTVAAARVARPDCVHVRLADGRVLVVLLTDAGVPWRVYPPEDYALVDLAQCREPSVAALWDVRGV